MNLDMGVGLVNRSQFRICSLRIFLGSHAFLKSFHCYDMDLWVHVIKMDMLLMNCIKDDAFGG